LYSFNSPDCALLYFSARTPRKASFSVVKNACLSVRYLAMDVLLLSACVTETCLSTCSLAMGLQVTLCFARINFYCKEVNNSMKFLTFVGLDSLLWQCKSDWINVGSDYLGFTALNLFV
jgi:hypothetical protein